MEEQLYAILNDNESYTRFAIGEELLIRNCPGELYEVLDKKRQFNSQKTYIFKTRFSKPYTKLKQIQMQTEIDEIVIKGTTYVPKGSEQKNYEGEIKIVVLQRGWVYIGKFERIGNDCKLHNAYCIRTWGTTKGLCELVNGATSSTKLDQCQGIVEFDWLTVVHTITVNPSAWKQI